MKTLDDIKDIVINMILALPKPTECKTELEKIKYNNNVSALVTGYTMMYEFKD